MAERSTALSSATLLPREWGSMLRQQQDGSAEARADAAASPGHGGRALPQAEQPQSAKPPPRGSKRAAAAR